MNARIVWVVAALSACAGLPVQAVELPLAKRPLFLSSSVEPNLVVTMDESGSMRSAWMPDKMAGSAECLWRQPLWYASATNTLYFNPDVQYLPPVRADGTSFPNANFFAAWVDGYVPTFGTPVDLSKNYRPTLRMASLPPATLNEFVTPVLATDPTPAGAPAGSGPTGPCTADSGDPTNGFSENAVLPLATRASDGTMISPAFYYVFNPNLDPRDPAQSTNASNFSAAQPIGPSQQQNFANWYSYYRTRLQLTRSATSFPFATSTGHLRMAWQNLTAPAPIGSANIVLDPQTAKLRSFDQGTTKSDFFQWLVNFRATGNTPTRQAQWRAGELFKRGGVDGPYWHQLTPTTGMELTCRQNYHLVITDGAWNDSTTAAFNPVPAPASATYAGTNIRTELPMTFPDGHGYVPNQASSGNRIYGNEGTINTGSCPGCLPTLSDMTWYYWATDLRSDLENNVPRRWVDYATPLTGAPVPENASQALQTPEVYFNPRNDPANWQHLVTYVVGLGVAGQRRFPDDYLKLRNGTLAWPSVSYTAGSGSSSGVDDSWHAAIASRGDYLSAQNPQELSSSLSSILTAIDQQRGSASAMTLSSGVMSNGTMVFQGGYDTADWSGFLEARYLTSSGPSSTLQWDAAAVLQSINPNDRAVITSSTVSGGGIPFRWNSLPGDYKALLNDNPTTAAVDDDGLGEKRVNYLRGNRSDEIGQAGGVLRTRTSLLGAIINSSPVVVAGPAADYDDTRFDPSSPEGQAAAAGRGYAEFRQQHRDRRRLVVIGANDGMLHAFDAGQGATETQAESSGTGAERWAYVPRATASRLNLLSQSQSGFEPYVDSTPTVRDAFVDGQWRTILVGALRLGGQGVFALDVSNSVVSEGAAADFVRWEFSDQSPGGEHLGYTYGKPNIVRLSNGKWAALVPGGYNNEQRDGHAGNGNASLYVLDLASGSLLRRFELPNTYGLSFATAGDYEGDFIDDFAVAGDALGYVWRFDLEASDPSAWTATKLFTPDQPGKQAVTSAPRIFADSQTNDLIVLFGTGRLLTDDDITTTTVQSLYAIREHAAGSEGVTRSQLIDQHLTKIGSGAEAYFRTDSKPLAETDKGWRVDLPDSGERIINAPGALFTEGVALVNSVIPSGGDPCKGGFRGNLYYFDAATGMPPRGGPYFDTNHDGQLNERDDDGAIGVALPSGLSEGTPASAVLPGGLGGAMPEYSLNVPTAPWRRRNWKDLAR